MSDTLHFTREQILQHRVYEPAQDFLAEDWLALHARVAALEAQIAPLADMLLKESGQLPENESACEMAVRVLREQQARVAALEGERGLSRVDEVARSCSTPNWDSYGGAPVTAEAAHAMKRLMGFLRNASIVPIPDGGLQLELHACGFDLELEVSPAGEASDAFASVTGRPDPLEQAVAALAQAQTDVDRTCTNLAATYDELAQTKARVTRLAEALRELDAAVCAVRGCLSVDALATIPELTRGGLDLALVYARAALAGEAPR